MLGFQTENRETETWVKERRGISHDVKVAPVLFGSLETFGCLQYLIPTEKIHEDP